MWANVFSGLGGVAVGFVATFIVQLIRERRRLEILVRRIECTYAKLVSYSYMNDQYNQLMVTHYWSVCEPTDDEAHLLIRIDVVAQNKSELDDAVLDATLFLHEDAPFYINASAQVEGAPFHGANVKSHSMEHFAFLFKFEHDFSDLMEWNLVGSTLRLEMNSIRNQVFNIPVNTTAKRVAYNNGDVLSW